MCDLSRLLKWKFIFRITISRNQNCYGGLPSESPKCILLVLQQQGVTKFITTVFGNVLVLRLQWFLLFKQNDKGGPCRDHKDVIVILWTFQKLTVVLEAGAMGEGGRDFIFRYGRGPLTKSFDLAKMISIGLKIPGKILILKNWFATLRKVLYEGV